MRGFYAAAAESVKEAQVVGLLSNLAKIEAKHKQRLYELYLTIEPNPRDLSEFEAGISLEMTEGGFGRDKLLAQSRSAFTSAAGALDFAMMLEAQAMDLYMRYADKSEDQQVKAILFKMADEEKAHLKSLGDLLGKQ